MNKEENPILKLSSENSGQQVFLFGSRHTNDEDDSQFKILKELWQEFLSDTREGRVAFTEGIIRDKQTTFSESVKKFGESGAVQWLAGDSGVEVACPEPNDIEQRKTLCSTTKPDLVAYVFIVQNLAAWFRYQQKRDFTNALEHSVSREAGFSSVYGFKPDLDWFNKKQRELFGNQLIEDSDFLNRITDPRTTDTEVNVVVAKRTKTRNEHVESVISKAWKEGKSIFIVYGKGHFQSLENCMRNLLK